MPFIEVDEQGCITIYYGISGIGKTTMGVAFAKVMYERTQKPTMYADLENGLLGIPPEYRKFMKRWVPDPANDILDEGLDMAQRFVDGDFGGLVVDTYTTLMHAALKSGAKKDRSEGKQTKRTRVLTGKGTAILQPDEGDYGMAIHYFDQVGSAMLPGLYRGANILWLAHETLAEKRDRRDSNTIIEQIGGPELVGFKLTKIVPKIANILLRALVVRPPGKPDAVRVLQRDMDGLYMAKDRSGAVPHGYIIEVPRFVQDGLEADGKTVKWRELTALEHRRAILEKYVKVMRAVFKGIDDAREMREEEKEA